MTRTALVAVQLEIGQDVLSSPDSYRAHIDAAAARALDNDASRADARLVVFPEVAGHLALYALAPPPARKAKTLSAALAASAVRRPLDVLRGVATTRLLDAKHAVLAALAPDGEKFWKSVFGPLARRHAAHVVAGSYLRLAPDGELHNASLLFGPDGRLLATTDKINLVPGLEDGAKGGLALARGDATIPITTTPLGTIATLIGYDVAHEQRTRTERFVAMPERVRERGGVAIVANPVAHRTDQPPTDELRRSLGALSFARFGVTAHLTGKVLDLTFDGISEVLERATSGEIRTLARAGAAEGADHVVALVDA